MDEASPFSSHHRPVVWNAREVLDPHVRPNVLLHARHFQVREQGITGAYHTALAAARHVQGARPGDLAGLYAYFLASIIRAGESTHSPPHEFGEPRGRVDQVDRKLQAHAKKWPPWWESLDTLKGPLDLRSNLAQA